MKTQQEVTEKWISNIKERSEEGGRKPGLRKWATDAAMCAGAAVKSAWSNRFCLSGTTTTESNWKSGGDLEKAVIQRSWGGGREVILSALQSRQAGDQTLTRLMVISFYWESLLPFFSSPLCSGCSFKLLYLLLLFFSLLISAHYFPPGTKLSCLKLKKTKQKKKKCFAFSLARLNYI